MVLTMAAFLVPFMGSAINLALPEIGERFDMSAVSLTWIATAYLISTAMFQIPFARLADMIGRRKVFLTGLVIFIICSTLCGFAMSGPMLIVVRFLDGMGSAMMFGTNIAIISSLFPPERRGKALAVNAAVVYAALAAGPFFGGMLTHYLGWHSVFFVAAGVAVVVLVLALFILRGEWVEARGEKFDFVGAVLYGVALAGIIFGFSDMPSTTGFVCLAGGLAALVVFVLYERRHTFPVLNVKLFSGNRVFTLSSLAALINYASTMGITFMLSLYLQYVRGLDASHAGRILICQAVVQSAFSLIAGGLSTRISPAVLASSGMGLIGLGLIVLLIFISTTMPLWLLVGILVMFGVGFGIFSSPNTNVVMGSVAKKSYSQASAVMGTMRLAGQSFSMGIASMAISFMVGSEEKIIPELFPEFIHSMKVTFSVFIILCVIGVYASAARTRAKATTT